MCSQKKSFCCQKRYLAANKLKHKIMYITKNTVLQDEKSWDIQSLATQNASLQLYCHLVRNTVLHHFPRLLQFSCAFE